MSDCTVCGLPNGSCASCGGNADRDREAAVDATAVAAAAAVRATELAAGAAVRATALAAEAAAARSLRAMAWVAMAAAVLLTAAVVLLVLT